MNALVNFIHRTIIQQYNRACAQKGSVCYQDHHCVQSGTHINETTVIPIFDNGYTYILAMTREVSRTQDLRESTYLLETYREAINEVALVAMTNQKGIIEVVNDLFEKTTGFKKEELIGKSFHMLNSNYHDESFLRTCGTPSVMDIFGMVKYVIEREMALFSG